MIRISIVLLGAVVGCALATVAAQHQARKLYAEIEREQEITRHLEVEWGQLQLEAGTWAAHARVEKIARERLGMGLPAPTHVVAVEQIGAHGR
jgi:cell division protein FtsL